MAIYHVDDTEEITVSNTSIGFTAAKITAAQSLIYAEVQVQGQPIRISTLSGEAIASGGPGLEWTDGEIFQVWGQEAINNFRAIREDAVDATLYVTYYKDRR